MNLLSLVVVIAVFGLIVWAITEIIPMPAKVKQVIYVIAIVGIVIYLFQSLGILPGFPRVRLL